MDSKLTLDFNNMMTDTIGEEQGLTEREINSLKDKTQFIDQDLKEKRKAGKLPFMDLPYRYEIHKEIKGYSASVKGKFDNFVLLGIGGSALGNIALHNALQHPYYNLLSSTARNGYPRMFFVDNIDPDLVKGLFDVIDLKKTLFNVITKSGDTGETMANFLVVLELLKDKLGSYQENIVATTDRLKGALRKIADKEGFKTFEVPDGVGGRFSVLSEVGLLSAAISGIDIDSLLKGAAEMDKICQNPNLWENPAYMNAVLHYLAYLKGKRISVMMPYVHRLGFLADWYKQLWAESLGKKFSLNGEVVHTGPTPVKAVGATDQHSQLQLYTEGAFDKVITFIRLEKYQEDVLISQEANKLEGIGYLGGHSLNELLSKEQMATQLALAESQRSSCTITLPEVSAFMVGQLIYMFEVQTAFAGGLFDINPFDQPGVEAGKIATYALMGRPGFEEKYRQIEQSLKKLNKKFIV